MSKFLKMVRLTVLPSVAALGVLLAPAPSFAAEAPGYESGHIWRFSFIKFRAGMRDRYLENLQKNYVPELEVAKKQGTILSYKVIQGEAATTADWNIIIMLELQDAAALGRFDKEMKKATAVAIGSRADEEKADAVRETIRDYLGIKSAQEIIFKK